MSKLHLDFETFSSADLRKVGLENYVASPDFTVTVVAWAFDDDPVQSVVWPDTATLPAPILTRLFVGGEIRAHNAAFEHAVLTSYYGVDVNPARLICTMQKALAYGLPAGLLAAGRALGLSTIKDETRRLLMLSMGRPRANGAPPWHEVDAVRLAELAAYCEDDVRAERAIDAAIPDLHPFERKLSLLDGEINRKGVLLDLAAVVRLKTAAERAIEAINSECAQLTEGRVTAPGSQVARLMAWLASEGTALTDVSRETVGVALDARHPAVVHRVLELRQQAAKSSVAKLERMIDVASNKDGRARHLLQFYGAGRTGRWAGRLIQPQNLPRTPEDHDAEAVIGLAEGLDVFWASPMAEISKTLRGCFVAKPGHVLVAADLSQIEARVLAWLAGQKDVVEAFARGDDVYVQAARKVGSANRQLGKVLVLACGYGMGAEKFRTTAAAAPYFVELTAAQATAHLWAWRDGNSAILRYWRAVEEAVRRSVQRHGAVIGLSHGMAVRTLGRTTQVKKPNGVPLTYHNMRLAAESGLVFDGVNGVTKKWGTERTYGGRLVENIVQSVARDVMAEAMLDRTAVPVMTVHDEIVWELPETEFSGWDRAAFTPEAPAWAAGLPVAAKLSTGRRYAK